MHKYRIVSPSNLDRFMNLISAVIETFGNENAYIPKTGILEVQTTMASDEFWNFLKGANAGIGIDEFWEVNDGDAS